MKYTIDVNKDGSLSCFVNGVLISNCRYLATAFQQIAQHHYKNTDEEGISLLKEDKSDKSELKDGSLGKLLDL